MSTREQLVDAKLAGAVERLAAGVRHPPDLEVEARHRAEWPELWERIDRLTELVAERHRLAGPAPLLHRSLS